MSTYFVTIETKANTHQLTDLSKLGSSLAVNKMMQEAEKVLFLELPNEIWVEILMYLTSAKDLCRVAQVSWHFYHLANDARLWRDTSPVWAPFNTLTQNTVNNRYWLRDTFFQSSHRVREKIINTDRFYFMLFYALYQPYLMQGHPTVTRMTFLFKTREEIVNICDVAVTETISNDSLTILIDDMKQAYQKVKNQDPDANNMVSDLGRDKGRNIKVSCWNDTLAHFAEFIIKHPHLGPRLTREHLENFLTVTAYSQAVASMMFETVFLHDTQLPALQTPVDETFFKLVAASLTYNDYYHLLTPKDNPSVPIAYVRKLFREKCLIQDEKIDGQYPLEDLIKLAYQDGRVALMLFAVPELTKKVNINTLFDLAHQDLQAGERHWARASFDRWSPEHYLKKHSNDSVIMTRYFSYFARTLIYSELTCERFINQLHDIRYIETYKAPDAWEGGFPLHLIQFIWAPVCRDPITFILPLSALGCSALHRLWQPFLAHRPTLQVSLPNQHLLSAGNPSSSLNAQFPTVKAVTQRRMISYDELPIAPLNIISTPSLGESPQQRVLDSSVSPPPVVSENRKNVPNAVTNIASQEVSSTSWGSLIAWIMSGVLTTVGIGLMVLGTVLLTKYMIPLMVGGFISLVSGLVLGLELLDRSKSVYEVRTSVDNYKAICPTLDTEPHLHQEAITYEPWCSTLMSKHEQLPIRCSMQNTQNLFPSTEETSVMEHVV